MCKSFWWFVGYHLQWLKVLFFICCMRPSVDFLSIFLFLFVEFVFLNNV